MSEYECVCVRVSVCVGACLFVCECVCLLYFSLSPPFPLGNHHGLVMESGFRRRAVVESSVDGVAKHRFN